MRRFDEFASTNTQTFAMVGMTVSESGEKTHSTSQLRLVVVLILSSIIHVFFYWLYGHMDDGHMTVAVPIPTMDVSLVSSSASKASAEPEKPMVSPPKPPQAVKPKPKPKPVPMKAKPPEPEDEAPAVVEKPSKPLETPIATSANTSSETSKSAEGTSHSSQGHDEAPKLHASYLHNPRPEYPSEAKRMEWEGRVILRVEVHAHGDAGSVHVLKSSGHEVLDEAAVEAVKKWKFVPAKHDGNPVHSFVNVPVNFDLKNE